MCNDPVAQIVEALAARYEHTYARQRPALRDQHAKSHGCVHARFVVAEDVPAALRHGLFASAGSYPALVRFSASYAHPRSDRWPDARGMAIKVFGPEGHVQDFVLANCPVFFVSDAAQYVQLLDRGLAGFVATRPRALANFMRATLGRVTNPLSAEYHSQTPFACGPGAVKYRAWPSTSTASELTATAAPVAHSAPGAIGPPGLTGSRSPRRDALRAALASSLSAHRASFDFQIQRQAGEPIDDATVRWRAPFTTVAQIEIAAQVPTDGEALSFSPGHCLPEHAPLGSINAVRVAVYAHIAGRRALLNAAQRAHQ